MATSISRPNTPWLSSPADDRSTRGSPTRPRGQPNPPPGGATRRARRATLSPGHEPDGRQSVRDTRQPPGRPFSKQPREGPRTIRPGHPGLKLDQPPAVGHVQPVNQAVQHHKHTNDEPDQQRTPPSCSQPSTILVSRGQCEPERTATPHHILCAHPATQPLPDPPPTRGSAPRQLQPKAVQGILVASRETQLLGQS